MCGRELSMVLRRFSCSAANAVQDIGQGGFEFANHTVGNNIPPDFVPAIEKGFKEAIEKGPLTGNPVMGVRVVLEDGAAHAVDSSELASRFAFRHPD